MRSTRSSARLNGNTNGNSSQPDKTTNSNSADAGTKRKAAPSTSPAQKRGRKASSTRDAEPKEQKTIEQTMDIDVDKNAPNDAEMKVAAEQAEDKNNDAAEEKITGECIEALSFYHFAVHNSNWVRRRQYRHHRASC